MIHQIQKRGFEAINQGYASVFQADQLSIGVVVPIENYEQGPVPRLEKHLERVKLIEQLGYKALWLRDIPFNVPNFGDAGQTLDPFTYLGFLAGQTKEIALGVASIALPLHHPLHVIKAATTVDQLSQGRMVLGVASGDRYEEYPAMGFEHEKRGDDFREAFAYIRKVQEAFPALSSQRYGNLDGRIDMLPKPYGSKIPLLLTGFSQQSMEWNAEHSDGWMYYTRNIYQQKERIAQWRSLIAANQPYDKPFMQALYVILEEDDDFSPQPIQLGFRIGINHLIQYFHYLKKIGVNHLALNLRFNKRNMEETLSYLAEKALPLFHSLKQQ